MNGKNFFAIVAGGILMMFFTCLQLNAQTDGYETIKIGELEYAVKILGISKNSEGNVEVRITGYRLNGYNPSPSVKFWQARASDGSVLNIRPELGIDVTSGGKTVNAIGFSIEDTRRGANEDALLVTFPTTVIPSEVIFFDPSDKTKKVVFNAATRKPKVSTQ